ncbi:MAG: hypothetical protein OXC62_09430 [Aestuariivita sp.]|nr:hypothetical protein [Aestuariivita sp.]
MLEVAMYPAARKAFEKAHQERAQAFRNIVTWLLRLKFLVRKRQTNQFALQN